MYISVWFLFSFVFVFRTVLMFRLLALRKTWVLCCVCSSRTSDVDCVLLKNSFVRRMAVNVSGRMRADFSRRADV